VAEDLLSDLGEHGGVVGGHGVVERCHTNALSQSNHTQNSGSRSNQRQVASNRNMIVFSAHVAASSSRGT